MDDHCLADRARTTSHRVQLGQRVRTRNTLRMQVTVYLKFLPQKTFAKQHSVKKLRETIELGRSLMIIRASALRMIFAKKVYFVAKGVGYTVLRTPMGWKRVSEVVEPPLNPPLVREL